jgi:FAD/FMN-containing dehydrogenase
VDDVGAGEEGHRGRRGRARRLDQRLPRPCREGEVDVVPDELGGAYDVMKTLKRALDPNNVMNPGKYGLDGAFEEDTT